MSDWSGFRETWLMPFAAQWKAALNAPIDLSRIVIDPVTFTVVPLQCPECRHHTLVVLPRYGWDDMLTVEHSYEIVVQCAACWIADNMPTHMLAVVPEHSREPHDGTFARFVFEPGAMDERALLGPELLVLDRE